MPSYRANPARENYEINRLLARIERLKSERQLSYLGGDFVGSQPITIIPPVPMPDGTLTPPVIPEVEPDPVASNGDTVRVDPTDPRIILYTTTRPPLAPGIFEIQVSTIMNPSVEGSKTVLTFPTL